MDLVGPLCRHLKDDLFRLLVQYLDLALCAARCSLIKSHLNCYFTLAFLVLADEYLLEIWRTINNLCNELA